ncbi:unnamed protein product [Nezara viridula]|uniref:Uncharacterized protein n=1 Tax=Nezara viridula TaxID=85310 RepID=A0A9P0MWS4_NEZVI|nr:unnamed protein product [Nezara viridula]
MNCLLRHDGSPIVRKYHSRGGINNVTASYN